jgi:hypothetical protein
MNISLQEIRDQLAEASPTALRAIGEDLAVLVIELRTGGRKLIDAHRAALELLRTGRHSEATRLIGRIVATCDVALAEEAARTVADAALEHRLPQGSA